VKEKVQIEFELNRLSTFNAVTAYAIAVDKVLFRNNGNGTGNHWKLTENNFIADQSEEESTAEHCTPENYETGTSSEPAEANPAPMDIGVVNASNKKRVIVGN